MANGFKWVLEGLNFRFDAQFWADTADARSQGRFDEFLSVNSYHMDAVANMDIRLARPRT